MNGDSEGGDTLQKVIIPKESIVKCGEDSISVRIPGSKGDDCRYYFKRVWTIKKRTMGHDGKEGQWKRKSGGLK